MSDDFIPLNQSTPVRRRWQDKSLQPGGYQNNWQQKNHKRKRHTQKHWAHNSQYSNSFGSDCNSSHDKGNKSNIDAYLHPSMLKDPWENLQPKTQQKL
ncbi:unnamed protein product [Euphydryas editha]|uniref:Uncharacterized protein n=1 Tax=Euphydryas editha TaxID=104508 RepID=A0AAU9V734_EUPED|nr:unnamed protein product [Euphydryas editha]